MKLYLYDVADGANVINKDLGVGYELNIRLGADVDIINPLIVLRDIQGVDYGSFNYAFIDVLGRYYFINKLAKVNARDSWLYLTCDVLETYKTDLLSSNCQFMRNIKAGDYYNTSVQNSFLTTVTKFESNKSLIAGDHTNILTAIGV